MISAPLLDIFGKGSKLPPGGSATFQTPYGTAGVSFVGRSMPPPPSFPTPGFTMDPFVDQFAGTNADGSAIESAPVSNALTPKPSTPSQVAPPAAADEPKMEAPANATQEWQQGASQRYYQRKQNRDAAASSKNAATRDMYRQATRIMPGAANIPGYGTPAAPPVGLDSKVQGLGTTKSAGYGLGFPLKFNNSPSNWSPY